jgi:hypothetical protein
MENTVSADLFGNLSLTLSAQLSFQSVKEFGLSFLFSSLFCVGSLENAV